MVTIFSDSCSDLLNKSKNTPLKFFPWGIGDVNFFGPKNRKIRVQNGSKMGPKWSKIGAYVEVQLESNQRVSKKVPTVQMERTADENWWLVNTLWRHFWVTSHQVTSSLSVCPIWVDVQDFFPWERLDILFWNLVDRFPSVKGSDCAIFQIFPGTFWCDRLIFRDYFFI